MSMGSKTALDITDFHHIVKKIHQDIFQSLEGLEQHESD